ncbi:MAG: iron ABC transporter permease [archaeon]|nr:iron ABC transporter permease [archaeon]
MDAVPMSRNGTGNRNQDIGRYLRANRLKYVMIAVALLALAVLFIYSLYLGSTAVTLDQIFGNIFGDDGTWEGYVIHDIRLKRSVAALIAGCGLGVAGAMMQCVLRNPLGSPYTLGLSNAAAFGAALGIMVLGGGLVNGGAVASYRIDEPYIVAISAFAFSMLATAVIVAAMKFFGASPATMVLAGMAISSIFSAGIAFLQYQANEMALSAIVFWQFGDLEKISWAQMPIIFWAVLIPLVYIYLNRWSLNAIDQGDEVAQSLGVRVGRTRVTVLVLSAVMTSVIVSFVGIIGFIGLLAPHVARRLVGDDKNILIPASAVIGSMVLLIAMMVSQNAFGFVIPVGIITSMIGGPMFLWILFDSRTKKKKRIAEFVRRVRA